MAKKRSAKNTLNTNKVKIIPLGGLGEIGRNMTVIQYEDEMIVTNEYLKPILENLEKEFSDNNSKNNKVFAPKEKIQDYIASTSDSGFNLDEVLNPGELELEDLCKELGLMEEEIL